MDRFHIWITVLFLGWYVPVSAQGLPVGNQQGPLNTGATTNTPIVDSPYSEMFGDARLNDVCFINSQQGWAVGDRGVLWTTFDGGTNWQLQNTPIDCTLNSVQFLNESFGIAVGHYWFPFTRQRQTSQGRGVILLTRDGGKSWQLQHTPDLPPLFRVKMFSTQVILLAGATSERYPSGLLVSRDGGQTWKPITAELSDGFAIADFYDVNKGIGIGFHGILQQFQNGIEASQTDSFGFRRVSAVEVNTKTNESDITAWAVGDRGLILSSTDEGYRWGVVPGVLPGNAAEIVDLKTVESNENNLWTAGNPGTCIYMSNDAGQTWKRTLTGVSATIRKIVFINPQSGWAVGDLGTILTTQNGGQTWQVQRTGSTKLALLGLFAETKTIPFEIFAELSADKGFLSGCAMVFRNEHNSEEQENRFHESVVRLGGSAGTELASFPILPKELWTTADNLAEHIQKTTDGRGMAQLRERLVITIRQWKPEILITSNYTNSYIDSAAEELAHREITEAVKLASDPSAYPYHLTELGLSPWNVKKVYLTLKNNAVGDVHINTSEPTSRFGMPLEEMSFVSRSLVDAEKCPNILGFINASPESGGKDFFAGIPLLPGDDGRRAQSVIFTDFQEGHRRRALQRRNILGILKNTAQTTQEAGQIVNNANLVAHAAAWTQKLDPDSAVQVLLNMAEQFHQDGDWHAASEINLILTQNYAQHPLVRQTFIRLMEYAASGEITEESEILNPYRTRLLPLTQFLKQNIPDLADEISVQFAAASAKQKIGAQQSKVRQESVQFYRSRSNLKFDDVWAMRARTEYWLTVPDKSKLPMEQRESPMPVLVNSFTGTKPFLDGKFDSEKDRNVWQRSQVYVFTPAKPRQRLTELLQNQPIQRRRIGTVREERLRQASQNFGTQVMFLYDPKYCYIGLRCPKVPEVAYPAAKEERLRDTAMPNLDRVEILIDKDRDYSTYFSLTIDSQGNVSDMCLKNPHWNPQWHVATHEDEGAWYIEAAIPFTSLTSILSEQSMKPNMNTAWGIAIRRLIPGKGIECWNAENSFDLTEGFGLLVFP